MSAAAVVLLDSVDSAAVAAALVAVVLQEPAGRAPRVLVPVRHEAALPLLLQLPPGAEVLVVARVPPQPLLHLSHLLSPRVVVESEAPPHLRYQSFSAAMARSSPPTVQPTSERAP